MFKRKIALKKARKLADCVPESLKQEIEFLNEESIPPITSLTIPILKINTFTNNLRKYPSLNNKSVW